jgi:cell division septation protein DedD
MSDMSRDRLDTADEDRLPWLEAVEDEDDEPGVGAGKLIAALIAGLVAIGLIVGGVFWLRERGATGGSGQGELIAAPEGPYKEPPANPGGMEVEGTGDLSYGASEGADVNSAIDLTAIPEAPVTEPQTPAAIEPVAKPAPAPAAKPAAAAKAPPPKPAPTPAPAPVEAAPAGPGTIQLGAFSSPAKANAAWKSLSGRFSFLGPLTSSVTPVSSGDSTLYRLRAGAGGDAKGVCAKLRVAGESCVVVN